MALRQRRWANPARRAAALMACTLSAGALLAGLSACAGSHGPTASEWAGSVCAALSPWRSSIADLNARAQSEIGAARTPAETRATLLTLLDGAASASEDTRLAILAAGTPDATAGAQVAGRFADSLAGTRDAYARAGTQVKALSTADGAAFYAGLVPIFTTLDAEYARAGVDTSGLDSPELRAAFAKVPQCQ